MKKSIQSIQTYEDLFIREAQALTSAYILGHLQIEFLLLKIVEAHSPSLQDFAHTLTHHKLIELVDGLQLVTTEQRDALLEINRFRNRFAHDISFEPSVSDFRKLFRAAQAAFSDMTDGIAQGLSALEEMDTVDDAFEFRKFRPRDAIQPILIFHDRSPFKLAKCWVHLSH